jgi:DNA-binding PadR family transcriptional regulator
VVLGAVYQFQPVHGYFLRRELMTWHADEWANTRPGSIYNALKALVRDGYITESGTETDGKYPVRTIYNISATGKVELLRMLRETLWNVDAFDTKAVMAIASFMFILTRQEVIAGIEHRISEIDAIIVSNNFHIDDTVQSETTPKYVREIFELSSARLRAEQNWAQQLAGRLKEGEYHFADEQAAAIPPRA